MEQGSVAIAMPSDPQRARALLVCGRRIARDLGVEWIAVRIVPEDSGFDAAAAGDLAELARASGGRLLRERASDVATALVELTRRERAGVLVLGRSRRPRLLRRLRRGTTERIVSAKRPFDVIIAAVGAVRQ